MKTVICSILAVGLLVSTTLSAAPTTASYPNSRSTAVAVPVKIVSVAQVGHMLKVKVKANGPVTVKVATTLLPDLPLINHVVNIVGQATDSIDISSLLPGSYVVTVTDAAGHSATATFIKLL